MQRTKDDSFMFPLFFTKIRHVFKTTSLLFYALIVIIVGKAKNKIIMDRLGIPEFSTSDLTTVFFKFNVHI